MPDGAPLRERKLQRKRLLSVWCPPALKRDVKRIAGFERRAISRVAAGLLRLGIGRYFELSDAKMIEPLREAMRDVFTDEGWIPEFAPVVTEKRRRRILEVSPRRALTEEFDAAIEEGKRNFEAACS